MIHPGHWAVKWPGSRNQQWRRATERSHGRDVVWQGVLLREGSHNLAAPCISHPEKKVSRAATVGFRQGNVCGGRKKGVENWARQIAKADSVGRSLTGWQSRLAILEEIPAGGKFRLAMNRPDQAEETFEGLSLHVPAQRHFPQSIPPSAPAPEALVAGPRALRASVEGQLRPA